MDSSDSLPQTSAQQWKVILSKVYEQCSDIFDNIDDVEKVNERRGLKLLKNVLKDLVEGAIMPWKEALARADVFFDAFLNHRSIFPDDSPRQSDKIAFSVLVISELVVRFKYQPLLDLLVHLDLDEQKPLTIIFDYHIKKQNSKSGISRQHFFNILHDAFVWGSDDLAENQETPKETPRKIKRLMSRDQSFTYSPSQTPKSIESPIAAQVRRIQRIAEEQSREALAAKNELDEERTKFSELQEELNKSKKENGRLKCELRETSAELSEKSSFVDELRKKIQDLENDLRRRSEESPARMDVSFDRKQEDLTEEIAQLRQALKEKQTFCESLATQLEATEAKTRTLENTNEELIEAAKGFKAEKEELTNIIESLKEEKRETSDTSGMTFENVGECMANVVEKELMEQKVQLESELGKIRSQLEQSELEKKDLKEQLETTAWNEKALEEQVKMSNDLMSKQMEDFVTKEQELASKAYSLEKALEETEHNFLLKVEASETEIRALRESLEDKHKNEANLNAKLSSASEKMEQLLKENQSLNHVCHEKDKEMAKLKENLFQVSKEHKNSISELTATHQASIIRLEEQAHSLMKEKEEFKGQLKLAKSEEAMLENRCKEFQKSLEDLQVRLQEKDHALEQSNSLRETILEEKCKLEQKLEKDTQNKLCLLEDIDRLQKELKEMAQEKLQIEIAFKQKQDENARQTEMLREEFDSELQNARGDLEKEVVIRRQLEMQLADLKDVEKDVKTKLQTQVQEMKANEEQKNEVLLALSAKDEELHTLRTSLQSKTQCLSEQESKISALESRIKSIDQDMKTQIAEKDSAMEELRNEKALKESEVSDLKSKYDHMEKQLEKLQRDLSLQTEMTLSFEKELQSKGKELNSKDEMIQTLQAQMHSEEDRSQIKIQKLQTLQKDLEEKLEKTAVELYSERSQREKLEEQIDLLSHQHSAELLKIQSAKEEDKNGLLEKIREQEQLVSKLKEAESSSSEEINRLEIKLREAEKRLENAEKQAAQLKNQVSKVDEKRMMELNDEICALKEGQKGLEMDLSREKASHETSKREHTQALKNLKDKYTDRMKQLGDAMAAKYKAKIEECESVFEAKLKRKDEEMMKDRERIESLEKDFKTMRGALSNAQLEKAEALKRTHEAEKQVKELQKKYEASKRLLAKQRSANNTERSVEATISKHESVDVKKENNKDDFAFKAPFNTPGRALPGKTKSDAALPVHRRIPRGVGSLMIMCDEPGEAFSTSYLSDMKLGVCPTNESGRLSELARRNTLVPAHLRSTYAAETQFFPPDAFSENDLRRGSLSDLKSLRNERASSVSSINSKHSNPKQPAAHHDVGDLSERTSMLSVDSPAANTRSQSRLSSVRSLASKTSNEKNNAQSVSKQKERKRRSSSLAVPREQPKRSKKEVPGTLYTKPGPATPAVRRDRYSLLEEADCSDSNASHDRTPLLDTTNTSNQSTNSRKFIKTPQSLRKVLTGAFNKSKRSKYDVKKKA